MLVHASYEDAPSSAHKKCLPLRLAATKRPCIPSIRRPTVNRTLVHKYKLFCLVSTYPGNVFKPFLRRPLHCNTCKLQKMISLVCITRMVLCTGTFFIVNPARCKVFHRVFGVTVTPQVTARTSRSSSRYMSGTCLMVPSKN